MDVFRNEEVKRKWEMRRDSYAKVIQETPDCDYLYKVVYGIVDTALSVGQLDRPDGMVEVKRLIKVKKILPLEILRINHPELILFEGVFLVASGLAIPQETMTKIGFYKKPQVLNTDILPPGYVYGTLRDVGEYGFALKESDITNYVTYSRAWEFVNLNSYSDYF